MRGTSPKGGKLFTSREVSILLAVAGLLLVAIVLVVVLQIPRQPFESPTWKQIQSATDDHTTALRFAMADDLVASGSLVGETRSNVLGLLGDSPETSYFSEYDLVYYLGPERSFMSIDSEWLLVRFDEADIAVEVIIARD